MSGQLSMNNSSDIVCNSLRIISGNSLNDVSSLFELLSGQINSKINVVDTYDKTQINAIICNYYTIEQTTTTLLNTKLDATAINNYYTKAETNDFLNLKANLTNIYNKKLLYTISEVNAIVDLKANLTDIYNKNLLYTKIETDNLINNKLDTSLSNSIKRK